MKNFSKKTFIILAGLLFASSIISDPLIHDHFEDNDSFVECQLCENKTFDLADTEPSINKTYAFHKNSEEINQNFVSPVFQNFQSRAPPKI